VGRRLHLSGTYKTAMLQKSPQRGGIRDGITGEKLGETRLTYLMEMYLRRRSMVRGH